MKIAIDIDGVIADFVGTFLPMLNTITECKFEDIVNYNFKKNVEIDDAQYEELWNEQVVQGKIYNRLKTIDGSIDAIKYLNENHEVVIVTSRREKAREATVEWLKEKQIQFTRLEMVEDLKTKIDIMCESDVVIEDDLEVARMLEPRGIPVIIFDYPWNRIGQNILRVKDWAGAKKTIETLKKSLER